MSFAANSSDTSSVRFATSGNKIVVFRGPADIADETTDAIVNAANSSLMGGGGVDGAIHRRGGSLILDECKRYVSQNGQLPPGRAMLTSGGKLSAKHVIHTVGPVYRDGGEKEAEQLASCHRECIRIAEVNNIRSLAFPAISTGAYGYPLHEASAIAINSVLDALEASSRVERIHFVLFDAAALNAYVEAAQRALKERPGMRIDT